MIEIIDYSLTANPGSIYVIWDMDGRQQPDYQPTQRELLDLLFDAGYITDFWPDDRSNTADIEVEVDGRRYQVEFERWLADEISEVLCKDVISQHLVHKA